MNLQLIVPKPWGCGGLWLCFRRFIFGVDEGMNLYICTFVHRYDWGELSPPLYKCVLLYISACINIICMNGVTTSI